MEVTHSARDLAVGGDGGRILVTSFISGSEAGEIAEVDADVLPAYQTSTFGIKRVIQLSD